MQTIKQFTLLIVLCFTLGISLTSCEKDLYEEGIKNSSRNITVKHVSLSNLDKTTSSKINEKISLIKHLKPETNNQGKFEYNEAMGVFIDTENGKLVNNNGRLYYTFPMFRKGEEKLENVIFTPMAGGEMETYFAKYNVTPQEFKTLTVSEIENLNPQLYRMSYINPQEICIDYIITVTVYSGCTETHANGETCSGVTTTFVATFCSNSSAGGGGGNGGNGDEGSEGTGNNPTGNNNGGTHPGGGGNNLDGIATTPVDFNPAEISTSVKAFIDQLTDSQYDCLNGLCIDTRKALLDLSNPNPESVSGCNTNNLSEAERFNFVEDILDNLCTAGNNPTPEYTTENYPGKNDGMPFAWWKDKDYIKANLRMPSDSNINAAAPEPNALEIGLFIIYPSAAILHVRNSNLALSKSQDLVLDGALTHLHNGKADAYRHTFWNARDTADFGTFITKLFTDAHEWHSCNDPKETTMDFFNNEQGRSIAQGYTLLTSDSTISNTILTAINSGSLLYLSPLVTDPTLQHDGDIIPGQTQILPTNQ